MNNETECEYLWPNVIGGYGDKYIITLTGITMLIAIPGNSLTLITILQNYKMRSEPAYLFICSVCAADLVVSLGAQSLFIATTLLGTRYSCALDKVFFLTAFLASIASTFGVILITMDRYLYIVYSLEYVMIMTQRRAIILIVFVWCCGVLFGLLPLLYYNAIMLHISILVILLMMTVFMLYTYADVFSNINKAPSQPNIIKNKTRNQATKTILLIVLAFFGCWYPWTVVSLIITIVQELNLKTLNVSPTSVLIKLHWIFLSLGYSNSALNVFVYSRKNTVLRKEVENFLGKKQVNTDNSYCGDTEHNNSKKTATAINNFASLCSRTKNRVMPKPLYGDHNVFKEVTVNLSLEMVRRDSFSSVHSTTFLVNTPPKSTFEFGIAAIGTKIS